MMTEEVVAAFPWRTNGHMIQSVAKLGYLNGKVLDATPGRLVFWKLWKPDDLTLNESDFRDMPYVAGSFDAVVFDPPYKLNGTPTPGVDERYGVHILTDREERHELMRLGLIECLRVCQFGGYVLMKCMDQVSGGKVRWQTRLIAEWAEYDGSSVVDRFDMLSNPRPQPKNRRQVHARRNHSTLLVIQA